MNSLYKVFLLIIPVSFIFISPLLASTPEPPNIPTNYVIDLANIITDDVENKLNLSLRELEQKTTAQVFLLTVMSLDGEDIEGFSLRVAEKWKIGQKGKDNGVLIAVAFRDRKYRFEIGYGLEGILPDSLVGSIGRDYLVPYLKEGDYTRGIYSVTIAIVQEIAKNEGVKLTGITPLEIPQVAKEKGIGLFEILLGFIVFFIAAIIFIRHPGLFLLLLLSSGGRSGWSGGGGFSSGGFGGGGSFGGGGASGGW